MSCFSYLDQSCDFTTHMRCNTILLFIVEVMKCIEAVYGRQQNTLPVCGFKTKCYKDLVPVMYATAHTYTLLFCKSAIKMGNVQVHWAWIMPVFSDLLCFLPLWQTHYEAGEYIIRQGARGDTFFIISKGKVRTGLPGHTLPNHSHHMAGQNGTHTTNDANLWCKGVEFLDESLLSSITWR